MSSNRARAGGCFLTLFIPAGFLAGLSVGDPMTGALIGLAAGAAAAVAIWLLDRRRGGGSDDPAP